MKLVLAACIAFLLAGCLTAQDRLNEAMQSFSAAAMDCNARHARGELKTYRERALCKNQAQARILGPVEPHSDLLNQEMAYRMVLADELDRKMITDDEANLKYTQFRSNLAAEAIRRQGTQAQINSQNAAAAALLMGAMRPAPIPMPQPIQTRPPINCTSVPAGNTIATNCY